MFIKWFTNKSLSNAGKPKDTECDGLLMENLEDFLNLKWRVGMILDGNTESDIFVDLIANLFVRRGIN